MKSKLIPSTILMLIFFIQTSGQDRVNRQKLIFNVKSGFISKAVGWSYNSTIGEWVDYDNVISNDKNYKDKYKNIQGQYMMSRIEQNFLNIQTKTLLYNETNYYVLLVEKWSGRYKYPSIKEDWLMYKQTIGYVFSELEFMKLNNIEGELELKPKVTVSMGRDYENYDETIFLDLIQTALSNDKGYASQYTFPVTKSKDGAIRFYLPQYFSNYSGYDFEKEYFETDYENFKNILIN
jgi:hypothetical protein